MKKKIYTALRVGSVVLIMVGLGTGGFFLHGKRAAELKRVSPPEKFPWALRTARVEKRDLTSGFPVLATISSQTEVAIVPQISGVIRRLGPREGQPVKKGLLLVQLDTQEIDNQLSALEASHQAAKAELALQQKERQRQETLLRKGYATQETVDKLRTATRTAEQKVKQLRGELEALKSRLKYGTILAPVDGVVADRFQELGDLAAPGRTIYHINAAIGAKAKITVPQAVAERLHMGSEIVLVHGDQPLTVSVSRVFPSLDALSMGNAEADLQNIPFGLPSGARLPGRVILDKSPGALVIPRTALILAPDGNTGAVFRVSAAKDGQLARLERIKVKIVASGREGVAVNGTVSKGDLVVTAQENQLLKIRDGDPVLPESEMGQ